MNNSKRALRYALLTSAAAVAPRSQQMKPFGKCS